MSILREQVDSAIKLLPIQIQKNQKQWFDHFWTTNFEKISDFPDMIYGVLCDYHGLPHSEY